MLLGSTITTMEEESQQGEGSAGDSEPQLASTTSKIRNAENAVNLTLLDPPRFGWTAAGGVEDVLPPHEVCQSVLLSWYYSLRNYGLVPFCDASIVAMIYWLICYSGI